MEFKFLSIATKLRVSNLDRRFEVAAFRRRAEYNIELHIVVKQRHEYAGKIKVSSSNFISLFTLDPLSSS